MNGEFEFQFPWVLVALVLVPLHGLLVGRSRGHAALSFPSAELAQTAAPGGRRSPGRLLLVIRCLALSCALIALAGPRMAMSRTERSESGVDIMLALDLSWSMMALDMGAPGQEVSRMDIARSVLEDFIRRRSGDRLGLIVFSAAPYLASPLTLNHPWLSRNLERLHVGMIRELGTAIGDATAAAVRRLQSAPNSKSRLIILLTDGDNNRGEIDPVPAAQLAAALGVKVYTIGIGLDVPCQLPAFDPGTGKLRRGAAGEVVPTLVLQPANYAVLGKMSALTGGRSYRATNLKELQSIYREIDELEKTEVTLSRSTTFTPLFQWPLWCCLGLLLLEITLDNTRFRRLP